MVCALGSSISIESHYSFIDSDEQLLRGATMAEGGYTVRVVREATATSFEGEQLAVPVGGSGHGAGVAALREISLAACEVDMV